MNNFIAGFIVGSICTLLLIFLWMALDDEPPMPPRAGI